MFQEVELLERLADLHQAGLLSDAEFANQKAELLATMNLSESGTVSETAVPSLPAEDKVPADPGIGHKYLSKSFGSLSPRTAWILAGVFFGLGLLVVYDRLGSGSDGRLCRSAISASLLNPETAEFRELNQISAEQFAAMHGMEANSIVLKTFGALVTDGVPIEGADFYSIRVRADGPAGNRVTKVMACAVNEGKCGCGEESG